MAWLSVEKMRPVAGGVKNAPHVSTLSKARDSSRLLPEADSGACGKSRGHTPEHCHVSKKRRITRIM
jgi:hypothetical protein